MRYGELIKQIIGFVGVGVVTFLIDIISTTILFYGAHFPAYLASASGFLLGFLFAFPTNRKRVFHHSIHDRYSMKLQVLFYLSLSLFNLIITSAIVEVLVGSEIEIQIAKILVTALIAMWNFLLFKFFIFSKKEAKSS